MRAEDAVLDVMMHGVFALDLVRSQRLNQIPILELMRTPLAVNLGIFGVVVVWLCHQRHVRFGMTLFSIVCLLVMTGLVFTTVLLGACLLVWGLAVVLQMWARRRGKHGLPLLAGWIVINALYFPLFFVTLPTFDNIMVVGELVLFWGPAFMVFRSLHYIHQCCKDRVDALEAGALGAFLHYVLHFPSFWFGPYQTFRQFSDEVSNCKERMTWRNHLKGWGRILSGLVKFLIIFHFLNLDYFYNYGYFGPFAERMFAVEGSDDPLHLLFMLYLFIIKIALFVSGLSDGVIGMNLLMGIRVPENSNSPHLSRDILEFWRRWHIQAGVFLREEVFFPVGGMRRRRWAFFCVFAYSGFWHFPSVSAVLAFPLLQLVLIELTLAWQAFWKRHEKRGDRIDAIGKRFYLHDSWLSGVLGIILVMHANVLSAVLIHDHFFQGTRILPILFGYIH
ncbi:MAG: MBOAT family O-acyltransferase [Labrys sp. (in: a-proteobacteria)]